MLRHTIIRRFAGTLADAEGLLAVERATFDESPYSAEQVQAMLTGGAQRAWLAVNGGQVIGFVAAFPTSGLRGPCWEIDLLAVHPEWTGQRLATRLIQTAAAGGMRAARRARAAVAGDNAASARAFLRAGFRRAEACTLLICQIKGQSPRPWTALGVTVREAASLEEAARLLPEDMVSPVPGSSATRHEPQGEGRAIHLLAEYHGRPAGYGELIRVQTLLYRGLWIESLAASRQTVRVALVNEALTRAISMGLDEIGMMVPESEPSLQETFLAAGFRSLGDFDWLRADLPLPGLAAGV
jgi:ribosomal protein S18 acetylase RimI-like enzyme